MRARFPVQPPSTPSLHAPLAPVSLHRDEHVQTTLPGDWAGGDPQTQESRKGRAKHLCKQRTKQNRKAEDAKGKAAQEKAFAIRVEYKTRPGEPSCRPAYTCRIASHTHLRDPPQSPLPVNQLWHR